MQERVRLCHIALQQRQTPRRAEAIGHSVTAPPRLEEPGTLREQRRCPRELAVLNQDIRIRPERSAKHEVAVGYDAEFGTQPRLFTGGAGARDRPLPRGAGLGKIGRMVPR